MRCGLLDYIYPGAGEFRYDGSLQELPKEVERIRKSPPVNI